MKVKLIPLLLLILASGPTVASADRLYMVKDRKGIITFTTKRPKGGVRYKTLKSNHPRYSKVSRKGGSRRRRGGFRVLKSQYDKLIKLKSEEQQLNPALVKAVIHIESAFNAKARSPKGAVGLMQLMPATAKRFGVVNRHDPADNITGGVKYLRWLIDHYKGNLRYALAAYNAGEGAVDRAGGIPPYKETINYVQKVTEAFKKYHKQGL